ncbi:hypothetical protein H0H93_016760 [Arthromyces matolae]|nr:hypothetical protein H0H93_016760 [Arthromyces matolae]
MERRSKRLREKHASDPHSVQPSLDGVASEDEVGENESARRSSSSRPKRKAVSRKRGKLESIAQFPLDVLFEIFGQLDPLDVLNLSRTSKALRNILMSRSSQFIWKRARAHIEGLPDCPTDMSEPAYANLVFSPFCNVSATKRDFLTFFLM